MKSLRHCATVLVLSSIVVPVSAHAHRAWMLPSSMVTSGKEPIVTIDAVTSEDLFDFAGMPIKLDGLSITAPDGTSVPGENAITGPHRSSFDVKLMQKGTYRIANVSKAVMAAYKVGGEMKRWRGAEEDLAKLIPANAEDLQVTRLQTRVETFVTYEAAGGKALQPVGSGLELIPVTQPTDLLVGDASIFKLLLDGKPVADATVTILRGGNRYRYKLGDITLKTDAEGKFSVKWPEAGQYWLNANVTQGKPGDANGSQPIRRISYSATFEVLPQ